MDFSVLWFLFALALFGHFELSPFVWFGYSIITIIVIVFTAGTVIHAYVLYIVLPQMLTYTLAVWRSFLLFLYE